MTNTREKAIINMMDTNIYSREYAEYLFNEMQKTLTPFRFMHSLGVAYMSACLATSYGVDRKKAYIAGLIHDCAKEIDKDELLRLSDRDGVFLTDIERRIKQLIHARYGAYLVKTKYGIEDEDIINAVKNHTVGRANMTKLEQIVFCADFLEPHREYDCTPSLDELRKMIFTDIDKATYLILQNQVDFFREKPRDIDPQTLETLEYYKTIVDRRS